MSEKYEIPPNSSPLRVEGEYFGLYSKPELQFVVSQLASLIVPTSPVVPDSAGRFYSISAREHAAYNLESARDFEEQAVNVKFLKLILGDFDHGIDTGGGGKNSINGVFFDFDHANLIGNGEVEIKKAFEIYISLADDNTPGELALLKKKIEVFKDNINGEDGLNFLSALLKKAGVAEDLHDSAQHLQETLLSRCSIALSEIEKFDTAHS